MRKRSMVRTVLVAFTFGLSMMAQSSRTAAVQLKAAENKEQVEGDLKGAIKQYEAIVTKYGKTDRAVAAMALVHMGECYQKNGDAQAQRIYEQVVRDYADQSAQANEARVHLASLGHNGAGGREMVMRRIWSGPDVDDEGAPTPDGKSLPFVDWSTGDLAVRDLATDAERHLTHKGTWQESDEFAEFSVPSADGKQVAYAWWNPKDNSFELRVILIDGSGVRTIYRNAAMDDVEPKAWTPDGKKILAGLKPKSGGSWQIALVSVADGSVQVLKEFQRGKPGDSTFVHGCISTDGRFIAYSVPKPSDESQFEIHLLSADGTQDLPVVTYPAYNYFLGWSPDGTTMVFASDRAGSFGAWAVPVTDGKAQGSPRLLRPDIGRIEPLGFARGGAFYYSLSDTVRDLLVAKLDFASGKVLAPPRPVSLEFSGANPSPVFSPDGKYLAYRSLRHHSYSPAAASRADTVMVRSLGSGAERELVPNLTEFLGISWAPDGRSLLMGGTDQQGRSGLFQVTLETGEASLLFPRAQGITRDYQQLTPDEKSLIYAKRTSAEGMQIMVRDVESGAERMLVDSKQQAIKGIAVSPDGTEVVYQTSAEIAEAAALKVIPLAGGEPRTLFSPVKPDDFNYDTLAWTPDGERIVFGARHGGMGDAPAVTNLWEIAAAGGEPQMLPVKAEVIRRLQIQADGQNVSYAAGTNSTEIDVIENLLPPDGAAR